MSLLIGLFILASISMVIFALFGYPKFSMDQSLGADDFGKPKRSKIGLFLSFIFPLTKLILKRFRLDVKIKNKLDAAHLKVLPEDFFNIKILFTISLALFLNFVLGKFEPNLTVVALVIGFILPDFWLKQKIGQRRYEIIRLLPETVDLLGLCVEAGLDFTTAVEWITSKIPSASNPMVEELALVLEEIRWGKPRAQALKDMASRLRIPEVTSVTNLLLMAERMGTPVSEALNIVSEDSRVKRYHRAERFALKAPLKILIPLIFCILPVIGIIIGGPIFLQFMQGNLLQGIVR